MTLATKTRRPRYAGTLCAIPDCADVAKKRGWCKLHYQRWSRTGDPLGIRSSSKWVGITCRDPEGCDLPAVKKGRCEKHYRRNHLGCSPQRTGYDAMHRMLRRVKGPASDYVCVDCGHPASGWALDNDSPAVQIDSHTKRAGMRFSTLVEDYAPRCSLCHKIYDLTWIRDHR